MESVEGLLERLVLLRRELSAAHADRRWRADRIDRLCTAIAEIERNLALAIPLDEQTNDLLPGY